MARDQQTAAAMLKAGGSSSWSAVKTADGKTYYMNSATQETSWDPPAGAGGSDVLSTVLSMLRTEGDSPEISKSAYGVLATLLQP